MASPSGPSQHVILRIQWFFATKCIITTFKKWSVFHCSFCKIPNILNFDGSHCMIKAGHFYTYCLVSDDGNVKILGSLCHMCIPKPARHGASPIFSHRHQFFQTYLFLHNGPLHLIRGVSTPFVVVFRGSSVRSSSFVENHQTTLG